MLWIEVEWRSNSSQERPSAAAALAAQRLNRWADL